MQEITGAEGYTEYSRLR